jgi:voltage-gated potassium channel
MDPHPHQQRKVWLRNGWLISTLNLVAVLVFYFAVPVNTDATTVELLRNILLASVGISVVGVVVFREARRQAHGGGGGLTGVHLALLFEIVLIAFALTYYMMAINGAEFEGIETRIDALYFTATTMTTVGYGDIHAVGQVARVVVVLHLAFDVVFVAALATLAKKSLGLERSDNRDAH